MSAVLTPEPASSKRYLPDDLLTMPDGDRYELVAGELVERTMGAESAYLAGKIFNALSNHVEKHKLGWVFPDGTSYQCFLDKQTARRPDVSFVKKGRLPNERVPVGHIKIAPDLAVEVISPFDTAGSIEEKVEEYLGAAVPLIWVVHPQMKVVHVHRLHDEESILRGNEVIEGEAVLPGFQLSLEMLFASLKKS